MKKERLGLTEKIIEKQIKSGLKDISSEEIGNVIIAYEPVWAIGTGKTASPEQAQEVHGFIRNLINEKYGALISENIKIQYGGSVNSNNAKELLFKKDIDGALIGGASLKADSFISIIQAT